MAASFISRIEHAPGGCWPQANVVLYNCFISSVEQIGSKARGAGVLCAGHAAFRKKALRLADFLYRI